MPSSAVAAFQKKYKSKNMYEVSQGDYLPAEHRGVCGVMVGHWIKRKQVHNKFSLQDSNKDGKSWMGCFSARRWESTRMKRKIAKYQNREWVKKNFSGMVYVVNQIETSTIRSGYLNKSTTGSDFFDKILSDAIDDVTSFGSYYDNFCYLISYKHVRGQIGGHAQGFEIGDTYLHFFDPNIGEYLFNLPGDQRQFLDHFAKDLWSDLLSNLDLTYYQVDRFGRGRRDEGTLTHEDDIS